MFLRALEDKRKDKKRLSVGAKFDGNTVYEEKPSTRFHERDRARLSAIFRLTKRPVASDRSELTHQPFNQYLEGSRGPQGIMQLYFNLATLGLSGYRSILGWTVLLRRRAEEAISLGLSDVRLVTDEALPDDLYATDKQAALQSATLPDGSFDEMRGSSPSAVVPIVGGRFLRLSDGDCNQLLISYVPAREAKLIATASIDYWRSRGIEGVLRVMRYLWRVNEHLWDEHIYANAHFTYYLGHTAFDLELPWGADKSEAAKTLAKLLAKWNAWARQSENGHPFFDFLAECVAKAVTREDANQSRTADELEKYARKFFCHKIVMMHPYTDESLLGDMLRRLAFWGERSVADVQIADATAQFLFPDDEANRSVDDE